MRRSTSSFTKEPTPTKAQKAADKIDLEPAKLKNHGGRFLYHPSQTPTIPVQAMQPKSADDYLRDFHPNLMLDKPHYEKEELVLNKATGKWIIVKESEMYKYS